MLTKSCGCNEKFEQVCSMLFQRLIYIHLCHCAPSFRSCWRPWHMRPPSAFSWVAPLPSRLQTFHRPRGSCNSQNLVIQSWWKSVSKIINPHPPSPNPNPIPQPTNQAWHPPTNQPPPGVRRAPGSLQPAAADLPSSNLLGCPCPGRSPGTPGDNFMRTKKYRALSNYVCYCNILLLQITFIV